jgi:hypothetical protein
MMSQPPRIVVSSNCQAAGLAAALLRMTHAREVHALPMGAQTAEVLEQKLRELAPRTDLWLVSANNTVARRVAEDLGGAGLRVVRVPVIEFTGFHPDICYARNRANRRLTLGHYNSAIVVWAYGNGLGVDDTLDLFRREVFAALGYFGAWNDGVEWLRGAFGSAGLEARFAEFFLSVKRQGCFMYSTNHPKIGALACLARLMAEASGLPLARSLLPGELNDGLNGVVWPLYPDLADELGLEGGSYQWKFLASGTFVDSLAAYVEQMFSSYEEQGIRRGDIEIVDPHAGHVDRVLRRISGREAR